MASMGSSKPWARSLHVDQYVDVLDSANKWSEAVVIGLTQNKVHVHFRGWSVRFNEWISFDSPRLAPAYTRVRNWRMLKKGDRVQLATEVSGVKSPVWRNGVVKQTRRGRGDSDVPVSVLVQVDGDLESRWVDTEDDCLCARGTHQVQHRAVRTKPHAGNGRHGDDSEKDDEEDDNAREKPQTIVLLDDDDDESGAATPGSSDSGSPVSTRGTRANRIVVRGASKPVPRRDDSTKERGVRKRKHDDDDDDDDFATWREALAPGTELEVADDKLAQWYEARVCDVRGREEVCVRFRGWPWHYDEWLLRSSPRLAPTATHLGRWRDFVLKQRVQIGFRASAKAEAPSRWETGVVTRVSRSMQTKQVKRVVVEWEADDGTTKSEWREANDDLLAPVGVSTHPLPKPTTGGPAFGHDHEEDDTGIDTPLDHDDASDPFPPSLADMLALSPDDLAVGSPTVAAGGVRTQLRQAVLAAADAFKGAVLAAVDAALGTARSRRGDGSDGSGPLEPLGPPLVDEDATNATDDATVPPATKRWKQGDTVAHDDQGDDGADVSRGTHPAEI